ncbi:pilus (MSHA type) biogenesis protein MshL [Chitinilyticum piscinae]|uniref:Secretin N-terminal domain-containing protein n=1 Tax=Chitinilyticum piscinae TaxID=2866724 RepID=A0A8J7FHC3_9NEIS|nr:pilus (MSHA type) biogenesis protein MshL [Chitinilyticum piscinae]MBE9607757.1 secretin N-terminal domain-containing protein [Chitinilyticum piscinae]
MSATAVLFLAGCATRDPLPSEPSRNLAGRQASAVATGAIPQTVVVPPVLPKPTAARKAETYSVVVSNVDIHDLLFALARDARINIDLHPGISGLVSINAINQTLPQIMERLSAQLPLRWTLEQGVLVVRPDEPYFQTYKVDYLNIARMVRSNVSVANTVSSAGTSGNAARSGDGQGSCAAGSNSSCTMLDYSSENQFWVRLERNLKDILGLEAVATSTGRLGDVAALAAVANRKTGGTDTTASSELVAAAQKEKLNAISQELAQAQQTLGGIYRVQAEDLERLAEFQLKQARIKREEYKRSNQVIINPESGIVLVRASQKDQRKVAEFLALLQSAAQRQVLIEATIVEVNLGDQYQAGVDWSKLASAGSGWSFSQQLLGQNLGSAPFAAVSFNSGSFDMTIKLLEQFGRTRVLSSPKVIALNNQTAVMKVVQEQVYFTIKATPGQSADGVVIPPTYESELHTVPVGLVMQVTPQIAETGSIALNVRPTITSISSYVADPGVAIIAASNKSNIQSLIPVTQVREFDSTLKVPSGQTAVLGGLIQESMSTDRQGIPFLSKIPTVGDLFSYRDDRVGKSELIVFLRPVLVRDASMSGDLAGLKNYLPGDDFFRSPADFELSAFEAGATPVRSAK